MRKLSEAQKTWLDFKPAIKHLPILLGKAFPEKKKNTLNVSHIYFLIFALWVSQFSDLNSKDFSFTMPLCPNFKCILVGPE